MPESKKRNPVQKKKGVTSDQVIKIKKTGLVPRRIGFKDKKTGKHYKFLINIFHLGAEVIAEIYKDRGQSRNFFGELNRTSRSRPLSAAAKTRS